MKFFYLEWSESKSAVIEAESESAARQCWIDGIPDEKVETFDAQMLEIYESNEEGEKL